MKKCNIDDFGLSIIWFMEKRGNLGDSNNMVIYILDLLFKKNM